MANKHMKRVFLAAFVFALMLLIPVSVAFDPTGIVPFRALPAEASAASDFTISNGVLTKYNGTSKNVTIPSSVTSIGTNAFKGNLYIESVTIPSGVTSIGSAAFSGCIYLESVSLPNTLKTMGDYAFESTSLTLVTIPGSLATIPKGAFRSCSALQSVTISNGVQNIASSGGYTDQGAFYNCKSLTSVTINSSSMQTIGRHAFYNCTRLSTLNIVDGLGTIDGGAFQNCSSLTSVNFPSSLDTVGEYAFASATGLTTLSMPGVTSIGSYAFKGCSSLSTFSLPKLKTMGDYAFESTGLTLVTIPGSLATIPKGAFRSCSALQSVTISNGVQNIASSGGYTDQGAFYNCKSLTSVTINSSSMQTIGQHAFYNCTSLRRVNIIEGLLEIHNGAFQNCTSTMSITIPQSVDTFGNNVFGGDKNTIVWVYENSKAHEYCEANYAAQGFTYKILGAAMTAPSVGPVTVLNSDNLHLGDDFTVNCEVSGGDYTIDRVSVSIFKEGGAHGVLLKTADINADSYSVSSMTGLVIPESYTCAVCKTTETFAKDEHVTVVVYAYSSAYGQTLEGETSFALIPREEAGSTDFVIDATGTITGYTGTEANLVIPAEINGIKVTDIGISAFKRNNYLTSVVIPEGVTAIGKQAFDFCDNLTSVEIPSSVSFVGSWAFDDCPSLTKVVIHAKATSFNNNSIFPDNAVIHCYKGSDAEAYAQRNGHEIVYLDGGREAPSMGEVTVPNSNNLHIGDSFTVNCEVDGGDYTLNRISVSIFKENGAHGVLLETVGINDTSYSAGNITGLKIPESYRCANCHLDESFNPDDHVTIVVYVSFGAHGEFIEGETSFTLVPKAEIDPSAFTIDATGTITGYTGTAAELVIPAEINGIKVTDIGIMAFARNDYLTSVVIPEGVTAIGKQAFDYCDNLAYVEIPSSVSFVGSWSFDDCPSLTKVVIHAKATSFNNNSIFPDNAVIHCYRGSTAEAYAQQNGHEIVYLDGKCAVCNEEDGPYQMNKVNANCQQPDSWDDVYYCSVCGNQSASYHVVSGSTTSCNQEDGPHQINKVNSTCVSHGSWDDAYYCSVCGKETARYHVEEPGYGTCLQDIGPVQSNKVNASCQAPDSWDDVYYCSICEKQSASYHVISGSSTGCNQAVGPVQTGKVNATCQTPGYWYDVYKCSGCNKETGRYFVYEGYAPCNQAIGPVQTDKVNGTCQTPGSWYDVYKCSVCDQESARYYVYEGYGSCTQSFGPVVQNKQYNSSGTLVYWEDVYFCGFCRSESARYVVDLR